jgi:hypothetical protein
MSRPEVVIACLACFLSHAALGASRTLLFQDGVAPTPAYAGTRDITISSQVNATQADPNTTYNVSPNRLDGYLTRQNVLLRWDLSTLSGVTVESARIVVSVTNGGPAAFPIYELLRPWNDATTTWNEATAGTAWSSPGASGVGVDRAASLVGTLAGPVTGTAVQPLNAAGVAMVQRWLDDPASNFGVVAGEPWFPDALYFTSNENGTATLRPLLELTHSGGVVTSFQNGVQPDAAYAGGTDLLIASGRGGWNGEGLLTGTQANILLRFDLSSIPPNTPILAADLVLRAGNKGPERTFHEVLQPWTEGATFASRDGTNAWASPGASSVGTDHAALSLVSTGPEGPPGTYTFPFNADGLAVLQAWVDGARPNHGLVTPELATFASTFYDRESSQIDARPALRIVYWIPDPTRFGVGCGCQALPNAGATTCALWLLALLGRRRLPSALTRPRG